MKEDHIQKLEVIASVILPNVYKQNQNLIQINKQNIEKVNYSLIHLTCDEKLYHPIDFIFSFSGWFRIGKNNGKIFPTRSGSRKSA